MTREQAIRVVTSGHSKAMLHLTAEGFIDALAELRVLKLDDSPTEMSRAAKLATVLVQCNRGGPAIWPTTLLAALDAANLELVEKNPKP